MRLDLKLPVLVGQLIVGGYDGDALPTRFLGALGKGHRGGAILFKRNLPSIEVAHAHASAIARAAPVDLPPFVSIDQEGGRVVRLPPPALKLPPMRALAEAGGPELVRRAAAAVALELSAIGFNLDFAPILDVDTNPDNPIIGDRSFGRDPHEVAACGVAFVRGLAEHGLLACGKHFPGHGDTDEDSHLDLPVVRHARPRLDAIELVPFRAAIDAGLATIMTAHVVCDALDPGVPATLSRTICEGLLRSELRFDGVLFSDDLEMKAIAERYSYEDAAVRAIEAGCDVLLVCRNEDAQDRVHEALVRRAERDPVFQERCERAAARALRARRASPPRPAPPDVVACVVGGGTSRAILDELASRSGAARA